MIHVRDELNKKTTGIFGGSSKDTIPPLTNFLNGDSPPTPDQVSFNHEMHIFSPLLIEAIFTLPVKLEHA